MEKSRAKKIMEEFMEAGVITDANIGGDKTGGGDISDANIGGDTTGAGPISDTNVGGSGNVRVSAGASRAKKKAKKALESAGGEETVPEESGVK